MKLLESCRAAIGNIHFNPVRYRVHLHLLEDPEQEEIKGVKRHVSFATKDVLEIGCGDGRVSKKYWNEPRRLVGIDPEQDALESARKSLPESLAKRTTFLVGSAEKLEFEDRAFDIVFFTWSLCCVQNPGKSLREAWRVLRPKGFLVNLMPDLEPSVEVGVLRALGGKEVSRSKVGVACEALVGSMKERLFVPAKEERLFFSVYPGSMDEFANWLPSYTGPFNKQEFASMKKESIEAMKIFAQALKMGDGFRVRDVLSLVSAEKVL